MLNISVVIISFNEASNIERCIRSAKKLSDNIIVIDSYSTDDTPSICKQLEVNFIQRAWNGYADQKNFGNTQAKHNWILSLDADEELTEALIDNIKTAFSHTPPNDAYNISFITRYCGKWIKHGRWYPEKHIRLFNKQKIQWNEDEVHEGLVILPTHSVGQLKGLIQHYTMDSIAQHLKKVNHYSSLSADKMYRKGKKANFIKLYISPFVKFFIDYFFRLGFLDGFQGFCIAIISCHESFLKYAKLKMLWKQNNP